MRRIAPSLIALLALAGPAAAQNQPNLMTLAALTQSLPLPSEQPQRPSLKQSVSVTGNVVHIGDLIAHAGALADIAVFRSPDLGTTGTVPAERVLEAVRPYGLAAIDTAGTAAVVVTRPGRAIDSGDIADAVRNALADQRGLGAAADLKVSFDQPLHAIEVEPTTTAPVQVARVLYSPLTHRFTAIVTVPGSASLHETPVRLTGAVVETAKVAVLTRALKRGEIIRASDLAIERRPRSELTDDHVNRLALALGLAAQHPMRRGQPLRQADLMKPELVARNQTVTLTYEVPGILLTMRGKAQEPGTEGDTINVLNLESKRVVQGTVTASGRVVVDETSIHVASRATANTQSPR